METKDYWTRRTINRRVALRSAGLTGAGAVALSLIGCGSSSKSGGSSPKASSQEVLDSTKGKPGGTLSVRTDQQPDNVDPLGSTSIAGAAGITNSALLAYKAGKTGVDGYSLDLETDLAQAMPEQSDQLTSVFKLRPGVKFHNGRALTAEDVKYSLEAYAFSDKSTYKPTFTWLDKVEAPDPLTVTVKSKTPFADAVQSLAAYNGPYVLAKEFEESTEASQRLMGSGPYMWESAQMPVSITFKKNPDYFGKPYPYFDHIAFYPQQDPTSQVTTFVSRQVQRMWTNIPDNAKQISQGRPDAQTWEFYIFGDKLWMKTDRPPYNDKRIRQALSRAIDRKQLRDAVFAGYGEDDQTFSQTWKFYGFKKPSQLKSAQNWVYDPAEAKKLLAAAGIDKPISESLSFPTGASQQPQADEVTLISARWKDLGIANIKSNPITPNSTFASTVNKGQYDGFAFWYNQQIALLGTWWYARLWSPPEGVKFPTDNVSYVNNPMINQLIEKQLGQFKFDERMASFHEMEEILGDETYQLNCSTIRHNWFVDPSVKNANMYQTAWGGSNSYLKYWWFDNA